MVPIRKAEFHASAISTVDIPQNHVIRELYRIRFRYLSDYRVWQATCIRNSIKLGLILEHITNLAGVRIVSMYPYFLFIRQTTIYEILFDFNKSTISIVSFID
jgi:hypothetical protein